MATTKAVTESKLTDKSMSSGKNNLSDNKRHPVWILIFIGTSFQLLERHLTLWETELRALSLPVISATVGIKRGISLLKIS